MTTRLHPTPPASAPDKPPRGADELAFLKSRARSVPLTREVANERVRTFLHAIATRDANEGATAHDEGTELNGLYMRHVDAVLGFPTWRAFLALHWPADPSTALDRQQIAHHATRATAARYGLSRTLYGLRIMGLTGLESFEALESVDLRLHADDGGTIVRFPASAPKLRSVIRRLVAEAATQPPADADSGDELRETSAIVRELSANDEGIAAIRPTAWADANGVHVRVTAKGRDGAEAAVRLYRRLAKR